MPVRVGCIRARVNPPSSPAKRFLSRPFPSHDAGVGPALHRPAKVCGHFKKIDIMPQEIPYIRISMDIIGNMELGESNRC